MDKETTVRIVITTGEHSHITRTTVETADPDLILAALDDAHERTRRVLQGNWRD